MLKLGLKELLFVSTEIYYFSGTGNSLVVARDIVKKTRGKLIAISSLIDKEIVKINGDMVGIVFPVYHQGIPFIIKRFVDKIDELSGKYIFGVCTYGDSPGISLEYLDNILRLKGGKLDAGFTVQMPYNYITPSFVIKDFYSSFTLREINVHKQQKMYANWESRLESVCEIILSRKKSKIEIKAKLIEHLLDRLNLRETLQKKMWLKIAGFKGRTHLTFIESIQLMDSGFKCDDKCNRCGICSKICPVKNIEIIDGKHVWQHHCEQCFACLQWCPREAIQFSKRTSTAKRYHNPNVKLSDMLLDDRQ